MTYEWHTDDMRLKYEWHTSDIRIHTNDIAIKTFKFLVKCMAQFLSVYSKNLNFQKDIP